MATLGASFPNLMDLYRGMGPDGMIAADIVEALHRLSPFVRNSITVEANKGASHLHTIRSGLPSVTWGRLYKGVAQSKSSKTQVEDTTGFVEGRSEIDERLLDLAGGNAALLRADEANGFLEAMAQEIETGAFYHDSTTTPEKFKGLAARYNVRGGSGAGNNVIHGGGSGSDNMSIWFVTHAQDATHFIHPKGTMAGIERKDRGSVQVLDSNNLPYFAQVEEFRQHIGLAVRDWRKNVRIANIDVSDVLAGTVDLYALMRQAVYRNQTWRQSKDLNAPNAAATGRTVIYMNSTAAEALDALATNGGADDNFVRLRPMELEGQEVLSYRSLPIFISEALLNTEATVPVAS